MVISIRFHRKTYEASSRMDLLPDGVVEYILSKLSDAKDVASCNCVSKKWKDSMSYRKSLCFPRGIFNNLTGPQTSDSIVMQMVSSVSRLEEIVVFCPYTVAGLASWLLVAGSSLKNLELGVLNNNLIRDQRHDFRAVFMDCLTKLECIQTARNLESLRFCNVILFGTPKWDVFHQLWNLEIFGALLLDDSVLTEALRLTPNLTRLVLVRCKYLSTICIEHLKLRYCHLDVYNDHGWSLTLRAPMIQHLEVNGSNSITIHETNCLKTLSISNNVDTLELGGNLMVLESLSIKGYQWHWEVITKMLQLATQVKHLHLEFAIAKGTFFPEIDFVEFFKSHSKLESLQIFDGMIDALCNNQMTTLKNVDSSFMIPCLEEVVIIVQSRAPSLLNTKYWLSRLIESFLKYGNKLNAIKVKTPSIDFSKEMHRMFQDSTIVSCDS